MKLRTFIALEVPDVQKQAILVHLNSWRTQQRQGINWVSPENLHLTLLFIGDTQNGDIPKLKDALFRQILRYEGFNMKCLGFELFPAREPRLLWVKLDTEDDSIFTFAKELNKTVRQLDYEPDAKPLKLHITVGRIKTQQPVWLEQEFLGAELTGDAALFDTVTFYQSILKPDGPVYLPLQQYNMIKKHDK